MKFSREKEEQSVEKKEKKKNEQLMSTHTPFVRRYKEK